jgi:hypothetical protein
MNLINLIKEEYNKIIKESKQDIIDILLDILNKRKLRYIESKLLKFLSTSNNTNNIQEILHKFLDSLNLEYYEDTIKSFGKTINVEYLLDTNTNDVETVFSVEEKKPILYMSNIYYNELYNIFKNIITENEFDNIILKWARNKFNDNLRKLNISFADKEFINEGYIDDNHKEEDIQELIDIIDLDPDNPRMKKHIDKLKNEYNYEYVKPEIRYKQDINIVNQIINKRYNVKTTKGFEFTFITKKPDNNDLKRTVQIEMFDKNYNNIGHVGFNIDSFKKTIFIGAAKVFDDYKRKGIYSAVVDFIQQVADKYNLFITEKSRTDDAREFWQDRITNNKINNVNYNL